MKTSEVHYTGIKQAVSDIKHNCSEFYRIYCNKRTHEVWAVEYADCNSYTSHNNDDVIEVMSGHSPSSIFGEAAPTMAEIKDEIRHKVEESDF